MFYKTLAAAAMTIALSTGAAMAQEGSSGEPGDSVQNPSTDEPGTPQVTGSTESDAMNTLMEDNRADWVAFFTDDTMTTVRPEAEIQTAFSSLTPEQQQALRDDCTTVTGDTSNSYGQSVVDLCTTVGGM